MKLLAVNLVCGILSSTIMAVGFRRTFPRLTLRLRLHIVAGALFWPIALASTYLAVTGRRAASGWLERVTYGGLIEAICGWWDLRQLDKMSLKELEDEYAQRRVEARAYRDL